MMGRVKEKPARVHKIESVKEAIQEPSPTLDPALKALFDSSIPREPLKSTKSSQSSSNLSEYPGKSLDRKNKIGNVEFVDSGKERDSDSDTDLSIVPPPSKKRKRADRKEEIEDRYLKRLALEDEKDRIAKKRSRQNTNQRTDQDKVNTDIDESQDDQDSSHENVTRSIQVEDEDNDEGVDTEPYEIPQHESVMAARSTTEVDKAARTVFLGNVSTEAIKSKAAKRVLLEHLASFASEMKDSPDHKIESIRFRSTAFSDSSIPKKAAFAKQQFMDTTTKGTNAYVVYSTTAAAREATKRLNGTVILSRHLRVDSVAHPAAIDHQRCVFVGNLGFVDDENNIRANETEDGQKRPKAKEAADIEEGLWVHFAKAGPVEGVRVVRDRTTRVGKGIAYVQFKDPNSVEKALLMNEKKFPPMLPRKLRVSRAKKPRKTSTRSTTEVPRAGTNATHPSKRPAKLFSLAGRADRMLGRAGAHHMRKELKHGSGALKSRKDIVFEGHRAVPNRGPASTKDGKKKRRDRRTTRSTAHRSQAGRK